MTGMIVLCELSLLKEHEQIVQERLEGLVGKIRRAGAFNSAIVADEVSFVILDGHHRFNAAKKLNLRFVPVNLVDYSSERITVRPRRNFPVSKELVVQAGLSGRKFPPKTTKHGLRLVKTIFSLRELQ
ncbi:MAG: ParB N-terminal domain-containing protein [Candidatus Micrarchaeota archaeon]